MGRGVFRPCGPLGAGVRIGPWEGRPAPVGAARWARVPFRTEGFASFWNAIPLLGMHPPLLFLRARRKRRAPCTVEKKKRAFGCRLGGSRLSSLAARVIRTLYRWCPVVTLAVLLTALRAGAGRRRCAVRSAFFAVGRLLQCAKMHCGKFVLRCFSFRCCWRNALLRCWGDVRYGVYLFAVRRLFMRAGMHCGKVSLLCFFFRCCCAMRSVSARLKNVRSIE